MSGSTIGGTIGAAIGYYFGGPTGAQWGWAIGSMAGAALMPEEIEGPRLDDLRPQGSEYGRPIPIIYGTAPIQGNVIWQSKLVEVASEEGGKGGGPEVTNYTYYANFAVLICEGEVELGRIWAGPEKRLIWDGTNLEGGGSITFYSGSTTQLPDPLMESYLGAGNVPAYRGWAYIVFENFPVANDGNRIPFLTIEVGETSGTPENYGLVWPTKIITTATNVIFITYGSYDRVTVRRLSDHGFVSSYTMGGTGTSERQDWFYDSDRNRVILGDGSVRYLDLDDGTYGSFSLPIHTPSGATDPSNYARRGVYHNGLYIFLAYPSVFVQTGRATLTAVDPDTFDAVWTYTGDAADTDGMTGPIYSLNSADSFLILHGREGKLRKVPLTANFTSTQWGDAATEIASGTDHWVISQRDPNTGNIWSLHHNGSTISPTLSVFCTDPTTGITVFSETFTLAGTYLLPNVYPFVFPPGTVRILMSVLSPYYRDYTIVYNASAPSTRTAYLGQYVWLVGYESYAGFYNSTDGHTWVFRSYIGWINRSTQGEDPQYVALGDNQNAAHPDTGYYIGERGLTQNGEALSSIVADLCQRAGVTSAQSDVSALTDTVDGYVIASQTTVQGAIQALQPAYFFDAVETGGKIKFVKRGGAIAVTIPDEDLGARQSGSDPDVDLVETTRQMDDELPGVLNVSYLQRATDYEVANKQARRIVGNSETEMRMDMAIVMTDEKAQGVADVNLHHAWVQRRTYRFSLPRKYSYLEPTDLVSVREQSMKLTKVTQAGGILKCEAFFDDYNYVPHVVVTETPNSDKEVYVVADTILHLLGTNMLRDADDGLYFYAAACGWNSNWDGAALYVSSDGGANYSRIGEFNYPATIGATNNALGDFFGGNTVDELNSITVAMTHGALSSTNEAGLLSGVNAAVVGQEVLFFRDATLVSSGVYKLTGLLRGRRGTEHHIGRHISGERFVLLSTATAIRLEGDTADIGIYKDYKGVSYGQSLADAAAQSFMLEGNTLKPYAPVQLGGGRNEAGDITITWVRRSRIAGSWRDSVDVPLGEASEEYAVDIMAGDSPSSVIRTISGITSQSTTYTAGQQVSDFGSTQSTVYFNVYQISALVGRGFAGSGSV